MKLLAVFLTIFFSVATFGQPACVPDEGSRQVDGLAADVIRAAGELLPEWTVVTDLARVQRSCLQNYGTEFSTLVTESIQQGLTCIQELDRNATERPSGARLHLDRFRMLYQQSGSISVICSETDFDWEGVNAKATTNRGQRMGGLEFPVVSLNPHYRYTGQPAHLTTTGELLKKGIFHEAMHTLGYRHGTHPEYAYACADCCFPKADDPDYFKASACRLCQGNYQDRISDPRYLEDLVAWARSHLAHTSAREIAHTSVTSFMNAGGNLRFGLWQLVQMGGYDELFNNMLGEEFASRFAPLGLHESQLLSMQQNVPTYPVLRERGSQVVKVFTMSHLDGSSIPAVLDYLTELPEGHFKQDAFEASASYGDYMAFQNLRRVLVLELENLRRRVPTEDQATRDRFVQIQNRLGL